MFKESCRRSANAACARVAERIARHARAMGFAVREDESRISASRYVYVELDEDGDEVIKIRVSDHAAGNDADFEVGCDETAARAIGGHWTRPLMKIAERTGRAAPAAVKRAADEATEGGNEFDQMDVNELRRFLRLKAAERRAAALLEL
jgi:hypothetical protein